MANRIKALMVLGLLACEKPQASISIHPVDPDTWDELQVRVESDQDADPASYVFQWFQDGELRGDLTGDRVPAIQTARDQTWRAEAWSADSDGTQRLTAAVVIVNAAPKVFSIDLSPSEVRETDLLQADVQAFDADGDEFDLHYRWYADGELAQEGDLSSLTGESFDKHQAVHVEVTPSDEREAGSAVSSAATTILNSLPSLDGAELDVDPIRESSTVGCLPIGWHDADGDQEGYLYAWSVNGEQRSTERTLDGASFDKGDMVACQLTPTDGEEQGEAQRSASALVRNTSPEVEGVTLSHSAPTEQDVLLVEVAESRDDDGDAVELHFDWYVEEQWVSSDAGLTGEAFDKGDQVYALVTPTDGEEQGAAVASDVATVVNSPPVAFVEIFPEVLRSDTTARAEARSSDADRDAVALTYAWTVNGASLTVQGGLLDGNAYFDKHDQVQVTVTPNDGEEDGPSASSSLVTVRNSPPTISGVALSANEVFEETTVHCVPSGWFDADGDAEDYRYGWLVNGEPASTQSWIDGSAFDKDDQLSCAVTPVDGEDLGATVHSETITVSNSAPAIGALLLSTSEPAEGDLLEVEILGATDPDGDIIRFSYTWYVAGSAVSQSSSLSSAHFDKGDEIYVVVTPADGSDRGEPVTSEVVVAVNTPPRITSIALSTDAPVTDSILFALADSHDADGDEVTIGYEWEVDGVPLQDGSSGLNGATAFDKGDVLQVLVTPNDGEEDGETAQSRLVVVVNSPPEAPEISIDPANPTVDEHRLVCVLDSASTDADGDELSYRFVWTVDGQAYTREGDTGDSGASWRGPLTTLRRGDTVPVQDTREGEEWSCTVTPRDDEEAGQASTVTETILGTPLPSTVSVGPLVGGISDSEAAFTMRMEGYTSVSLQICESPDFDETIHETEQVRVVEDHDYTAQLYVSGLQADTRYYYRVLSADVALESEPLRSFATAPEPDANAEFSFAVLADQNTKEAAECIAYGAVARLEPDFVMQIGDFDHRNPAAFEDVSVERWRLMHRDRLKDTRTGQLLDSHILSSIPFFHTWDDHDFGDDNASGFVWWREYAKQAFFEYFPLPESMPNPDAGIWHSIRWGQAEIFMLDNRYQRCQNRVEDDPGKSMLDCWGVEDGQKYWLLSGLLTSDAVWKFVVSGSVWNPDSKEKDSWHLYQTEQREILDFIDDNGISGVIVLSADLHSGGGIDDGTHSGVPEMSVPTTNFDSVTCTCGYCGEWSEGIWEGNSPAGFSMVQVGYEEDVHYVELQTYGEDGTARMSYRIEEPQG